MAAPPQQPPAGVAAPQSTGEEVVVVEPPVPAVMVGKVPEAGRGAGLAAGGRGSGYQMRGAQLPPGREEVPTARRLAIPQAVGKGMPLPRATPYAHKGGKGGKGVGGKGGAYYPLNGNKGGRGQTIPVGAHRPPPRSVCCQYLQAAEWKQQQKQLAEEKAKELDRKMNELEARIASGREDGSTGGKGGKDGKDGKDAKDSSLIGEPIGKQEPEECKYGANCLNAHEDIPGMACSHVPKCKIHMERNREIQVPPEEMVRPEFVCCFFLGNGSCRFHRDYRYFHGCRHAHPDHRTPLMIAELPCHNAPKCTRHKERNDKTGAIGTQPHVEIVREIKKRQCDDNFRERWNELAKKEGGNKKDPARHSCEFLRIALKRLTGVEWKPAGEAAGRGGGVAAPPAAPGAGRGGVTMAPPPGIYVPGMSFSM